MKLDDFTNPPKYIIEKFETRFLLHHHRMYKQYLEVFPC